MGKTLTQKIRQAAFDLGDFNSLDLAKALNINTEKELRKMRVAVRELKYRKEIISLRRGFYRYQGKQKPLNKTAKMWRAIRIKERFTRQDIKKLSGASKNYVVAYLNFLVKAGFICHISGRGFKGKLYCLIEPESAPLNHPVNRTKTKKEENVKS